MIFETLFLAVPFFLGLGVSAQRRLRALGIWVVLEVLLFWLAATVFRQPLLAASLTTLLFGTLGFGAGLLFARNRQLQAGAAPGVAFLGGVLLTATLSGALEAPLRKETLKTAKWVNTSQDLAAAAVIRAGEQASERMWWVNEGASSTPVFEPSVHLRLESSESQLSRPLLHFTGADYWLTPQDERTHVLRSTNFDSRLLPTWLWWPIEQRLVLAEHRAELEALSGEFVPVEDDGVQVLLTVQTSPPTVVTVVPPFGSHRPRLVLGHTPLSQRSGAQVGDTVLLANEAEGLRSEEVIEYGHPGEVKVITKVFRGSR